MAHYVLRGFCGPCAKGTGVVTRWRDRSFPLQGPSFLTNLLSPLSPNIDDNDTSLYINTTSFYINTTIQIMNSSYWFHKKCVENSKENMHFHVRA